MSRVSEDTVGVDDDEFCGEIVQLKSSGTSKPYAIGVWTVCGPIMWIVYRNARDTYYVEVVARRETEAETPTIGKNA